MAECGRVKQSKVLADIFTSDGVSNAVELRGQYSSTLSASCPAVHLLPKLSLSLLMKDGVVLNGLAESCREPGLKSSLPWRDRTLMLIGIDIVILPLLLAPVLADDNAEVLCPLGRRDVIALLLGETGT